MIDEHGTQDEEDTLVVIMAGGRGERLGHLTLIRCNPNRFLCRKVSSRPITETILDSFAQGGFKNFYFSVNYMAESVKSHFGDGSQWGVRISYLEEKSLLFTVGCARPD